MTSTLLCRAWAGALAAIVLAGCATSPPPAAPAAAAPPTVASPPPPPAVPTPEPAPAATAAAVIVPDETTPSVPPMASMVDPKLPESLAERDLWVRIRKGFAIPDLEGDLVRDREQWYGSRPDYVQRMTARSSRYLYYIVEEIERRGMPTELALLPFIESAFNPQALSTAKASGMWQFIPSTGKHFDLTQNIFRDERRDVLASTRAALDYLGKLHAMFDDWHLALAAYNWGEGSVQRAIARNRKAGLPTDYQSLRMPAETRLYVPKLQAVENIIADPQAHGLSLPAIENHPYFLTVAIQRDIDVALAVRLAGLPMEEFRALNPQMNKPVILAAGVPHILLPYDNANKFVRNLSDHQGPLASWTAWVVPRTMSPRDAAAQAGVSEDELREVNKIPPRMLVKAGSTLLVPRHGERHQRDVPEDIADNATIALTPDAPPMRRVVLRAGKRDTVASVARRYKLSVTQVADWNRVGAGATFARGQRIVIYQPARSTRALASSSAKPEVRTKAASSTRKTAVASKGGKSAGKRVAASASRPVKAASSAKGSTTKASRNTSSKVRVAKQ